MRPNHHPFIEFYPNRRPCYDLNVNLARSIITRQSQKSNTLPNAKNKSKSQEDNQPLPNK